MTRDDISGFGFLGAMALVTMVATTIGMVSDGFELSKAITWGIMVGPGFYGGVVLFSALVVWIKGESDDD
jgi:hypothetical protein